MAAHKSHTCIGRRQQFEHCHCVLLDNITHRKGSATAGSLSHMVLGWQLNKLTTCAVWVSFELLWLLGASIELASTAGTASQQARLCTHANCTHTLLGRSDLLGAFALLLPFFATTQTLLCRCRRGRDAASLATAGCATAAAAVRCGTAVLQLRASMLLNY
jgi:hypothetical protein